MNIDTLIVMRCCSRLSSSCLHTFHSFAFKLQLKAGYARIIVDINFFFFCLVVSEDSCGDQ